jgi:ABC-2 type transport system permease protein
MTSTPAHDARWAAVRAGLSRGWIETRQQFTEVAPILGHLVFPVVSAVMLVVMRRKNVPGTEFSLGAMVLPSLLGMSIAFGGVVGPASALVLEREDGTLLRAKATPHGMAGYLLGKIVTFGLTTLLGVMLLIVPGSLVAGELIFATRTWLLLAVVFIAGMLATVPIGVALGSLMTSSAQAGLVVLAVVALVAPSGIFMPITSLPAWMQWVGQSFPFYWVGLGARSALLPQAMAAAEIGGSWRTLETFAMLGAWAALGLLLAPGVLRRMARRQSGSAVARARERIMAKGY